MGILSHYGAVFSGLATGLLVCAGLLSHDYATAQNVEASPDRPKIKRVVKDVAPVSGLYHVTASKTPSGFPVPRYVALKKSKTYGRTGPSRNHAIAWEYRRRGLPVIVVAETELWRKVRDYRGDESWVHKSMLTGERHVLVVRETALRKKSREASEVVAVAQAKTVLKLETCEDHYCRVQSRDGFEGWITRSAIWGADTFR